MKMTPVEINCDAVRVKWLKKIIIFKINSRIDRSFSHYIYNKQFIGCYFPHISIAIFVFLAIFVRNRNSTSMEEHIPKLFDLL